MNRSPILFLFGTVILSTVFSCKKGFKTTDTGLRYQLHTSKDGVKPREGDILVMHMVYTTENDSLLFDSDRISDSFKVVFPKPAYRGSVEEGFALLSEGDSATFIVPADSVFEKTFHTEVPAFIRKGSDLKFHIRLKSLIPREKFEAEKKAKNERLKLEEPIQIENYLQQNHYTQEPSKSGLYYIELKKGEGDLAADGDSVFVKYTGKFLDNKVFDSNTLSGSTDPIKFKLGEGLMIPAWEEGIKYMREGGMALFVCPSALAYGSKGLGPIQPYTPLLFNVELVKIKK